MAKTTYLRTLASKNKEEVRRWKHYYDQMLTETASVTKSLDEPEFIQATMENNQPIEEDGKIDDPWDELAKLHQGPQTDTL